VGDLRKFLKLLRGRQLNLPGRLQASLKEHRLIMAAFHHQNPGAAEKIMHDHLMAQRAALASYDTAEAAGRKHGKDVKGQTP
jgi:DNA-binding FadR family transcriptional regulator